MEEAFATAKETKETNAVREQFVAEVGLQSWETLLQLYLSTPTS